MFADQMDVQDEVILQLDRARTVENEIKMTGRVEIVLRGPDGRIKTRRVGKNIVVTAGKDHIADQLSSSPGGAAMSHMAIGTGSSGPAAGDTALGAETDRNALTSRTDATNVVTYVGTWAPADGTNAALRECGIFNAGAAGTMLARHVYSNIDKAAGDTLTITWTVTVG